MANQFALQAGRPFLALMAALFVFIPTFVTADPPPAKTNAAKEAAHRVPYQLTDTKHILVRVKLNGQGPFNFIMDTGAPAVFIATHAAKKAGLKPDERGWGVCERFDIEGGARLDKVRGRIEDPFQLTGMNKMNLAGFRLDGILGYTALAQFRIEFDFTRPYLVWTKLDWEPPWPEGLAQMGGKESKEVAAMGGLVNFASMLVGRRPDPEYVSRGFLGVELNEKAEVTRVLPGSPAEEAGLKKGDRIVRFQNKAFKSLAELQQLAGPIAGGQSVELEIERGQEKLTINLKTTKAL